MRELRFTVLTSLVGASLLPAPAMGAGYYVSDIGTRGLARAGAFIAAPDSLLAIHYNPAALSLLSGLHFETDVSLVDLNLTFRRSCPCVDSALPNAVDLDRELEASFQGHPAEAGRPHAIPFVAVGYGLPFWDLTVAFAAHGPNSGNYKYGAVPSVSQPDSFRAVARSTPHRYTALDVETLEANFQVGFGFMPAEGLRVGGSIIAYQNANTQTLHLWVNSNLTVQPENPELDVPITFQFRRNFALNWALGLTYEALPGLSIGGSFRGKRSVRAKGSIDTELQQYLRDFGADVTGRNIEVELNTPPIARVGVEYAVPKVARAEVALVSEWWSVYRDIVVRPQDIEFTLQGQSQKLGKIVQERGWENSFSLRVGGEVNALEPLLGVRAGYFFEPSAIPPERLDVTRVDLDKHGFALGVSTTLYGASLEISAMYIALATRDVRDSRVQMAKPLAPPLGSSELVTTIGNGTYEGNYLIGSMSLSFALDPVLGL